MPITIVPHFHYDVAYLQTFEQYLPRCFDNLREAIRILDAEPDYRFLIEQPILLEQFRARCPEDFTRLQACAARGQVEVACGMWCMPDMNIPSGESLVRQALLGKAWVREHLGLDVTTCWIADCWGHPATLPQILRHCGYQAYAFSRGMRPELQRTDFRWRSPDGSEILTHWLALGYGPLLFPDAGPLENALEQDVTQASEERLLDLVERMRPMLSSEHVLIGNGGDFVRPQASGPELVRRWQARGHAVRFGLTRDHFNAVAQEDLPLVEGEFNPIFTGSYGTRIGLKLANRRLESSLLSLERALALRKDAPTVPTALWQTLLKNQFHDIASGTIIGAANREVEAEYAEAETSAEHLLTGAVQALGGGPGESYLALFNPSAFPRREVVHIPASAAEAEGALLCQPDARDGGYLAEVALEPLAVKVLSLGQDAPATAAPAATADGQMVLENGLLRVTVAPDGTLASVVDCRTGRESVDPARPYWGDLLYRSDNGDLWILDRCPLDGGSAASRLTETDVRDPYARSADPLVNAGPICQHGSRPKVTLLENGPLRWLVRVEGALGFWRNRVEFQTYISLRRGSRRIEFETRIVPNGRHYRLHACFPTALRDGRIRHEVAFGIQERDERLYAAQNWMDLSDGAQGVCLLNRGIPGNMACDGVLSLLLFRAAAMEYKGESTDAFGEGVPQVFHYAVLPWEEGDEYLPHREGEAFNLPLLQARCGGPVAAHAPGLSLTPNNVQVTGFYRSGENWVLRIAEASGNACEARLRLPKGLTACHECDGLENPGAALPVTDGVLCAALRPFQIRSFLLRIPAR